MHTAPPVRMSLMPDKAWRAVGIGCTAVAAANVTAWLAQYARLPSATTVVAALGAALVAGVCLRAWAGANGTAVGVLTWDGAQWQWSAHGAGASTGAVRVRLDLGAWILLRFGSAAQGHRQWLVATRGMAGPLWPAWRAALYARTPGDELPVP